MIVSHRTRAWSSAAVMPFTLVAAGDEIKLRNLLRVKQFSSHGVMVLKNDSELFKSVERRA